MLISAGSHNLWHMYGMLCGPMRNYKYFYGVNWACRGMRLSCASYTPLNINPSLVLDTLCPTIFYPVRHVYTSPVLRLSDHQNNPHTFPLKIDISNIREEVPICMTFFDSCCYKSHHTAWLLCIIKYT